MAYRIFMTHSAEKELRSIDRRYQKAIRNRIEDLKTNPHLGKQLKAGLSGLCSLREGVYRIIYEVVDNELIIYIVRIAHRQGSYK